MTVDHSATVWSSTWVPSPSPVSGFGVDGYAVAWVDTDAGSRLQVLVDGPAPAPGTRGRVVGRIIDDGPVEIFEVVSS